MSLKEETQLKKFGGADLKSETDFIWFSVVGQSKKKKKKKKSKVMEHYVLTPVCRTVDFIHMA